MINFLKQKYDGVLLFSKVASFGLEITKKIHQSKTCSFLKRDTSTDVSYEVEYVFLSCNQ